LFSKSFQDGKLLCLVGASGVSSGFFVDPVKIDCLVLDSDSESNDGGHCFESRALNIIESVIEFIDSPKSLPSGM
jgi:hypothetical protein